MLLVPSMLVLVPLIAIFAEGSAHWTVMGRSVAIALICVGGLTLIAARVLRNPVLASVLVTELVWAFFEWRVAVVLGLTLVALAAFSAIRRRRLVLRPAVLLLPVTVIVLATIARAVSIGAFSEDDFRVSVSTAPRAAASAAPDGPNVYVLLLDGYPRQDSLSNAFAFDNEPFLQELEANGFAVNRAAKTEFERTELTLSSLSLADHSELDTYPYDAREFARVVRRDVRRERLVNTMAMDQLRDLGYRLIYVPSPVTFVDWTGWDERRDPGTPTDYESVVIQRTPLRFVLGGWLLDEARERVSDSLDKWRAGNGKSFVFAHVQAPHPPFLWDDDGPVSEPLPCWYAVECYLYNGFPRDLRLTEAEYSAKVGGQVASLNELVLRATKRLIRDDPRAVIVIFSDHGTRYRDMQNPEANRSLFAARGTNVAEADGLFIALLDELSGEGE